MKSLRRRLFNSFRSMRQCAYNPNNPVFQRNQRDGHQIEVHWSNFQSFYSWVEANLGPPPTESARIIRLDQLQSFAPGNIEWGDYPAQQDRLRTSVQIRYRGRSQCLKSWCRELGLNIYRVRRRWHAGIREPRQLFQVKKP
jgi:hypothetical protein